jgi:hypothetical protein
MDDSSSSQQVVKSCWDPWSLLKTFNQPPVRETVDESVLVQELNSLSVQERERLYEEMHGVVDVIEETPEFVAQKLATMRGLVKEIPSKMKKALERAIFLRPSIESDDKLHLMFLRAKKFDAHASANMMVQHFENKLALFGEDLLVKKITLECLTENEMKIIRTGSIQMLRNRESQGRVVFFMSLPLYDCSDWKAFTRYIWYQIYSAVENDEELQKKGLVQVLSFHGPFKSSTSQILDFFHHVENFHKNWAFHVNCVHYCFDNPTLNAFLNGLTIFAGKELRLRQRRHPGSPMEAQYSLLTFGISALDFFVPDNGIMSKEHIEGYIEERRRIEADWIAEEKSSEDPKSTFALYPNKQDVLIGRGKSYREWPGTIRLTKMVSMQAQRYVDVGAKDRIEKTIIAMQIISMIENDYGGRFLVPKNDGWEVAAESMAKEKVSGALRTEARLLNKVSQAPSRPSSRGGADGYASGGSNPHPYSMQY